MLLDFKLFFRILESFGFLTINNNYCFLSFVVWFEMSELFYMSDIYDMSDLSDLSGLSGLSDRSDMSELFDLFDLSYLLFLSE